MNTGWASANNIAAVWGIVGAVAGMAHGIIQLHNRWNNSSRLERARTILRECQEFIARLESRDRALIEQSRPRFLDQMQDNFVAANTYVDDLGRLVAADQRFGAEYRYWSDISRNISALLRWLRDLQGDLAQTSLEIRPPSSFALPQYTPYVPPVRALPDGMVLNPPLRPPNGPNAADPSSNAETYPPQPSGTFSDARPGHGGMPFPNSTQNSEVAESAGTSTSRSGNSSHLSLSAVGITEVRVSPVNQSQESFASTSMRYSNSSRIAFPASADNTGSTPILSTSPAQYDEPVYPSSVRNRSGNPSRANSFSSSVDDLSHRVSSMSMSRNRTAASRNSSQENLGLHPFLANSTHASLSSSRVANAGSEWNAGTAIPSTRHSRNITSASAFGRSDPLASASTSAGSMARSYQQQRGSYLGQDSPQSSPQQNELQPPRSSSLNVPPETGTYTRNPSSSLPILLPGRSGSNTSSTPRQPPKNSNSQERLPSSSAPIPIPNVQRADRSALTTGVSPSSTAALHRHGTSTHQQSTWQEERGVHPFFQSPTTRPPLQDRDQRASRRAASVYEDSTSSSVYANRGSGSNGTTSREDRDSMAVPSNRHTADPSRRHSSFDARSSSTSSGPPSFAVPQRSASQIWEERRRTAESSRSHRHGSSLAGGSRGDRSPTRRSSHYDDNDDGHRPKGHDRYDKHKSRR